MTYRQAQIEYAAAKRGQAIALRMGDVVKAEQQRLKARRLVKALRTAIN